MQRFPEVNCCCMFCGLSTCAFRLKVPFVWVSLALPGTPQVSVFDSSVQGGDAVWEGVRVYRGKVFCLDRCVRFVGARLFFSLCPECSVAFRACDDKRLTRNVGAAAFLCIVCTKISVRGLAESKALRLAQETNSTSG